MIKLLRNLLGDYKVLHTDNNGNHERIEWQYLEQLCSLQEDLGFSLANKLKRKHVLYKKHKMSVSLAAETFSASVADAFDFLQVNMAIEDFAGSKPTSYFIRKVDEVFDLLNSRNPFAKGHKAPVSLGNLPAFLKKCDLITKYLFELRDERGNLLRAGQRKTCIWGLTLSIRSLMAIAIDLLM